MLAVKLRICKCINQSINGDNTGSLGVDITQSLSYMHNLTTFNYGSLHCSFQFCNATCYYFANIKLISFIDSSQAM